MKPFLEWIKTLFAPRVLTKLQDEHTSPEKWNAMERMVNGLTPYDRSDIRNNYHLKELVKAKKEKDTDQIRYHTDCINSSLYEEAKHCREDRDRALTLLRVAAEGRKVVDPEQVKELLGEYRDAIKTVVQAEVIGMDVNNFVGKMAVERLEELNQRIHWILYGDVTYDEMVERDHTAIFRPVYGEEIDTWHRNRKNHLLRLRSYQKGEIHNILDV